MKMEQIDCSETSAYKIQSPGNHPEENIQHDLSVFVGGVLIACNAGMAYTRRAVDGATAATSERSWSAVQ
jgi:hypothetical protein